MPRLREVGIGLRNIFLGGSFASVRMWRDPKEWAVASTEVLAIWDSIADSKGVTLANVHEVFGQDRPVRVELWNPPMGAIAGRTVDMLALCQLCSILKPKVVFEIGTLHGQTALHFAMNGADQVLTLDLPSGCEASALHTTTTDQDHKEDYSNQRMEFAGTDWQNQIQRLFGDSATFDYSPYYGKVALFFIDGAHSYEYVRSDTLNALRCLEPGGVIAWHDFGRRGVNGVSLWLRELNRIVPVNAIPGGSLAFVKVSDPVSVAQQVGA
jgi:predicted O-methyltransferase YrrM